MTRSQSCKPQLVLLVPSVMLSLLCRHTTQAFAVRGRSFGMNAQVLQMVPHSNDATVVVPTSKSNRTTATTTTTTTTTTTPLTADFTDSGTWEVPERFLPKVVAGQQQQQQQQQQNPVVPIQHKVKRIARDDVDRLSRGQPSKKKGYGSRNVPHRLDESERAEFDRAAKKGFLTLSGNGNRRTRKGSPLRNIHRQWCDAREKPQILVFKAMLMGGSQQSPQDQVVIDLAPLRLNGLFDDPDYVQELITKWASEILDAAKKNDMTFLAADENSSANDDMEDVDDFSSSVSTDRKTWAIEPIWKLPTLSVGTFEGERTNAKDMARDLAILWEIPEMKKGDGPENRRRAGARKGGKTKMKGLSRHRSGY